MKINVKSKGTQPTCQMPFVLSCEHWILSFLLTLFYLMQHDRIRIQIAFYQ